ncbi:MAG: response regulator transcription factor [Acidobacteriota bacterium]
MILIVEDDRRLCGLLERSLREEGYQTAAALDGLTAWSMCRAASFDLIVLDLMLPGLGGLELLRRLRSAGDGTPVLVLTARDSPADVVAGLDLGADDYLTKPFDLEIFLARARAALRRGPACQPVILRAGPLELHMGLRQASVRGRPVPLTKTEYALLELLVRRRGRVVPRELLLEEVWGHGRDVQSNTLDAFISALRAKVDAGPDRRLIRTVRGVGYVLEGGEDDRP